MWVTGCRIGWGLVPRCKPRLMIICGLLAAEYAEDWFQGLSKDWWLYVGYWLQNWLRIGSKVDDYMWVTGCRIGWWLVPRFKQRLMIICGLLAAELAEDWFQGLRQRLMIICGLLAAELAEDWFQGLSQGWWLYVGYWLQNWLRIGSKV